MVVELKTTILILVLFYLAISKRVKHRARPSIPIPDVPDEIFYKVKHFAITFT